MKIESPHIPLGTSLLEGVRILRSLSPNIQKRQDDKSVFYGVDVHDFACGLYEKDGIVIATWYNDPVGRETEEGINSKVSLYLARYGDLDDWEETINNGWIQFFMNEKTKVGMAYGLHKDVIRFNDYGQDI